MSCLLIVVCFTAVLPIKREEDNSFIIVISEDGRYKIDIEESAKKTTEEGTLGRLHGKKYGKLN